MTLRLAPLAVTLLAILLQPAMAQEEEVYADIETIHGDADGFFEVFGLLQDAVMFGDPVTIADYAIYPLTVNANGESYEVLEEQDLIDNFESLFPTEAQQVLLEQDPADLIVTQDGVGIGNGAIWITNVCLDDACEETQWGIISLNN